MLKSVPLRISGWNWAQDLNAQHGRPDRLWSQDAHIDTNILLLPSKQYLSRLACEVIVRVGEDDRCERANNCEPGVGTIGVWGDIEEARKSLDWSQCGVGIELRLSTAGFDAVACVARGESAAGMASLSIEVDYGHFEWEGYDQLCWNISKQRNVQVANAALLCVRQENPESDRREALELKRREWMRKVFNDEREPRYGQLPSFMDTVSGLVIQHCLGVGENEAECEEKLEEALDIICDVRYATNPNSREVESIPEAQPRNTPAMRERASVWHHGRPDFAFAEGFMGANYCEIRRDMLQVAGARYLKAPFMQCANLEKLIVDAEMFAEITEYGESIKRRLSLRAYLSSKGRLTKFRLHRWTGEAIGKLVALAIVYIAPGYLLWRQLKSGGNPAVFWLAVAFSIFIALSLVAVAVRWIVRQFAPNDMARELKLWQSMVIAYGEMAGEVVNPSRVREVLSNTANQGAVWSGLVWALVDRAIQRDPAVWQ